MERLSDEAKSCVFKRLEGKDIGCRECAQAVAREAEDEIQRQVDEVIDKALPDFSAEAREEGHPKSYWAGYHYARGLIRHHWQELKAEEGK